MTGGARLEARTAAGRLQAEAGEEHGGSDKAPAGLLMWGAEEGQDGPGAGPARLGARGHPDSCGMAKAWQAWGGARSGHMTPKTFIRQPSANVEQTAE